MDKRLTAFVVAFERERFDTVVNDGYFFRARKITGIPPDRFGNRDDCVIQEYREYGRAFDERAVQQGAFLIECPSVRGENDARNAAKARRKRA